MLTMAVVIPVTGWFLQRFTTRQAFTVAMGTFCAGTVLAAAAPWFSLLVLGRIVQAAGTAVMLPLLMTTLMTIVPEHDRGRVMGNVTLAISVAPALGPTVAGLVLEVASWRWLFLVVLPVAIAITAAGLRRLDDVGETRPGRLDVASVVLAGGGFGGLVYGLSRLGVDGSGGASPWAWILGGLLVVGLFALRQRARERRPDGPLLDLRVLSHRAYARAVALQSVAFLAMLGTMILLPLYLQEVRGLTPLQTGLLVAPGGLAMGLLGPRVGRASDRWGARPLLVPGSVGVVVALVMLTQVGLTTSLVLVVAAHLVLMVSLACVMTPSFTLGLGALPEHLYSHGSSLLGTSQQVAAAVGTALSVTVLASRAGELAQRGAQPDAAFVGGMQWAFAVAAVLGLVAVGLSLLLPDRVAGSTHEPDEEVAEQHRSDRAPAGVE